MKIAATKGTISFNQNKNGVSIFLLVSFIKDVNNQLLNKHQFYFCYSTYKPYFCQPKKTEMNNRREFEIAFVGLRPGVHEFEYKIEDKFFVPFGEQDFTNLQANVKLTLDKQNGFLKLKFDVDGVVDVDCDRCGNGLKKQLWDEFNIIVKMVDEPEKANSEEEDSDIYYISKTESHLKIADWIYEFINLSVPMQKNCGEEKMGGSECNNEVLMMLKKMEDEVVKESNPMWKGLDNIKGLE